MSNSDLPYNPFDTTSSIDKIAEARQAREKQKELLKEEIEEYKAALNRIFASPDGRYLVKKWMKYSGIFLFDNNPPDGRLAEEKGKRKFFIELIWQFLDKTNKMEIIE